MPQFVMEGRDHAARAESPFVMGFIEALFFTENSPAYDSAAWFSDECEAAREAGQADGRIPGDVGYSDLHPDSLAAIRADCEAWQTANAALLALAYARPGYDEAQAGRDYWFTRNGHGVGFWDRKELGPQGEEWEELRRPLDTWSPADSALHEKLKSESIGSLLTQACQYQEAHVFFGDHVTHGDSPFVHVDGLKG